LLVEKNEAYNSRYEFAIGLCFIYGFFIDAFIVGSVALTATTTTCTANNNNNKGAEVCSN
jgi:hypothetical protein